MKLILAGYILLAGVAFTELALILNQTDQIDALHANIAGIADNTHYLTLQRDSARSQLDLCLQRERVRKSFDQNHLR